VGHYPRCGCDLADMCSDVNLPACVSPCEDAGREYHEALNTHKITQTKEEKEQRGQTKAISSSSVYTNGKIECPNKQHRCPSSSPPGLLELGQEIEGWVSGVAFEEKNHVCSLDRINGRTRRKRSALL